MTSQLDSVWTLKRSRAMERLNQSTLCRNYYKLSPPDSLKQEILARNSFWKAYVANVGPIAMNAAIPIVRLADDWDFSGSTIGDMEYEMSGWDGQE